MKTEIKIQLPSAIILTVLFIAAAFVVVGGCSHSQDAKNFWENMENRGVGKL